MSTPSAVPREANEPLPSISVVIPTYNRASLLAKCIEGVRALDYPPALLETVVVDNGSTDGTSSMLGRQSGEVKYIRLESNTGFAPASNRGAAEASGEYIAFLNNDAVPEPGWLQGLLAALRAGGEGAVCAGARILAGDGDAVEYDGASANLFGVGRPTAVSGWPDQPEPPGEGSPILFASGGAMLVRRDVFLHIGGFDPAYFAYFEDVDFGWRLWVLGHRVVYAPNAVVRHIGGATGGSTGIHRRYALWESNALATIIKNYEHGNMPKILAAALMLEYRRAVMAAGPAIDPSDYRLGGPPDANPANVERLPRVSVAHLAAIDRLNSMLPHLMAERARIQLARKRPDAEILRLMGSPFEPQFAGDHYAERVRRLAEAFGLYGLTAPSAPNRVVVIAGEGEESKAFDLAGGLSGEFLVAVVVPGTGPAGSGDGSRFTVHHTGTSSATAQRLMRQAGAIVATPAGVGLLAGESAAPVAVVGATDAVPAGVALAVEDPADPRLLQFCRTPRRGRDPSAR